MCRYRISDIYNTKLNFANSTYQHFGLNNLPNLLATSFDSKSLFVITVLISYKASPLLKNKF